MLRTENFAGLNLEMKTSCPEEFLGFFIPTRHILEQHLKKITTTSFNVDSHYDVTLDAILLTQFEKVRYSLLFNGHREISTGA
jgi:hypothetical protein